MLYRKLLLIVSPFLCVGTIVSMEPQTKLTKSNWLNWFRWAQVEEKERI